MRNWWLFVAGAFLAALFSTTASTLAGGPGADRSTPAGAGPPGAKVADRPEVQAGPGVRLVRISDTRDRPRRRRRFVRSSAAPALAPGVGAVSLPPGGGSPPPPTADDSLGSAFDRPLNDHCTEAIPLAKGTPAIVMDDRGSTNIAVNNRICGFVVGGDLFFNFTADEDGFYRFDTEGSDHDHAMALYRDPNACDAFDQIACDGAAFDNPVVVYASLNAGQTITIRTGVDDPVPDGGLLVINITCANDIPPPANDDFANATVIGPDPGTFAEILDTRRSTPEGNDPEPACGSSSDERNSIWYTVTPTTNSHITCSTQGSSEAYYVAIYGGTPPNLVERACGNTFAENNLVGGVTYWILVIASGRVSQDNTEGGILDFECTLQGTELCTAPCVVEDAWTADIASVDFAGAECEQYLFVDTPDPNDPSDDIYLVDKFKVPAAGYPDGVSADYFFEAANPKCPDNLDGEDICFPLSQNQNLPVLILNDIHYPPSFFPPSQTPYEVRVAVAVDPSCFPLQPGDNRFDWWKVVEFKPAGPFLDSHAADCDGDGDFDVGFILNGFGGFNIKPAADDCRPPFNNLGFRLTECTDNYGAEVIEFFVNRNAHDLRCLNVFESHPPMPVRSFPDVDPGEDSETRPWAFTIRNNP